MCFSASASFVAGASLSAIGVAALTKTETKAEQPLAMVPLLFGVQQVSEGVIWWTFAHDAPVLRQVMTHVYSGFSQVLWPMYVPFAFSVLETVRWRRRTLFAFEAVGGAVGLYLLYSIVAHPIVAEVIGRHIVYHFPLFYWAPVMVLYVTATCVSGFLSSHRFVRLFGILSLLSFVAAYVVAVGAVVSVWCFFAAMLSVLIYLHLRFRASRPPCA